MAFPVRKTFLFHPFSVFSCFAFHASLLKHISFISQKTMFHPPKDGLSQGKRHMSQRREIYLSEMRHKRRKTSKLLSFSFPTTWQSRQNFAHFRPFYLLSSRQAIFSAVEMLKINISNVKWFFENFKMFSVLKHSPTNKNHRSGADTTPSGCRQSAVAARSRREGMADGGGQKPIDFASAASPPSAPMSSSTDRIRR